MSHSLSRGVSHEFVPRRSAAYPPKRVIGGSRSAGAVDHWFTSAGAVQDWFTSAGAVQSSKKMMIFLLGMALAMRWCNDAYGMSASISGMSTCRKRVSALIEFSYMPLILYSSVLWLMWSMLKAMSS